MTKIQIEKNGKKDKFKIHNFKVKKKMLDRA